GSSFNGSWERSIILIEHPNVGQRETDGLIVVLSLYLKSALRNDMKAATQIASMYLNGLGAPVSPVKAWHWVKFAADKGLAEASVDLSKVEGRMTTDELNKAKSE